MHGAHGSANFAGYSLATVFAVDRFGDQFGERGQFLGGPFQHALGAQGRYGQPRYEHHRAEEDDRHADETGHGHEQRFHLRLGHLSLLRVHRVQILRRPVLAERHRVLWVLSLRKRLTVGAAAVLQLLNRVVVQRVKVVVVTGYRSVRWPRRVACAPKINEKPLYDVFSVLELENI